MLWKTLRVKVFFLVEHEYATKKTKASAIALLTLYNLNLVKFALFQIITIIV